MPSIPPRPSRSSQETRTTLGQPPQRLQPAPAPRVSSPAPQTAAQPSRAQQVPVTQTPPPQSIRGQRLSAIRTFNRDVSQTVQGRQLSMADIALAEQRRRRATLHAEPTQRRSYIGTVILILLLLGIGSAALYVGYQALQPPENLVSPENIRQPLIVTETEEEIDITSRSSSDLREQLRARLRLGDITIASIREYYFTVQRLVDNVPAKLFVGAPLFLDSLGTSIPADLLRNLADRFMYGIFSFDGNRGFLIVRPTSLTIAFASMREWEDATLVRDIAPILNPEQITQDDIFAPFIDTVISNQDVRIAKNSRGEEVLLYSLTSQNMLVITTDSETFKEVIARLNTPPPIQR